MTESPTEGVIRYKMEWKEGPSPLVEDLAELLTARAVLFHLGLIGWDKNENVGYGNLSCRGNDPDTFYVSGTQTSGIEDAGPRHFTTVTFSDPAKNELHCTGPVAASSEAMTHGMLYRLSPDIHAVIHVHNSGMWKRWMNILPTTPAEVEYGTPAMAGAIENLFLHGDLAQKKILVMEGHLDGLIAFGSTPEEALNTLLNHHR